MREHPIIEILIQKAELERPRLVKRTRFDQRDVVSAFVIPQFDTFEPTFGMVYEIKSKRSNTPRWGFPGGRVQQGETSAETVRRELLEESGIAANVSDQDLLSVIPVEKTGSGREHVVVIYHKVLPASIEMYPGLEQIKCGRFTADNILQLVKIGEIFWTSMNAWELFQSESKAKRHLAA